MHDVGGGDEKAPRGAGLLIEAQEAMVRQIVQDEMRLALGRVSVNPGLAQAILAGSPVVALPDQGCDSRATGERAHDPAELRLLAEGGQVLPLRKLIEILQSSLRYPRVR